VVSRFCDIGCRLDRFLSHFEDRVAVMARRKGSSACQVIGEDDFGQTDVTGVGT